MTKAFFYCPLLSAAVAARDEKGMELIMRAALCDRVPTKTIYEIILQSHLFLGFPAMIEAARLFSRVKPTRFRLNHLPGPYRAESCRRWNRSGMLKIGKMYGPAFERLVPYINSFSPHILTWMINDGYGRVLSRPGASFKLRELAVVATLTVTGYENQLRPHIRGTVNHGVDRRLVADTIRNARFFCSPQKIKRALEILDRIVEG